MADSLSHCISSEISESVIGGDWQVVEEYVKSQGKPKEEFRQLSLL